MQIVVLMGFVVSLTVPQFALPEQPWWVIVSALAAYVCGTVLLSRLRMRHTIGLLRDGGQLRRPTIRRLAILSMVSSGWLVAAHGGLLALSGDRINEHFGDLPLVGKLAALSPFVVALLIVWVVDYPIHVAMRRRIAPHESSPAGPPVRIWTRREYLTYNIRHHLLFLAAPICLIVLITDALGLYVYPVLPENVQDYAALGGAVFAAGGIFLAAPVLLVRIWRTRHLPDGPLRADLEAMACRMRLRYRDILIWQSGGVIANAAVMGLIGPARYVLLSDALLEGMDGRQVRAVFAHEAGHITSHHIFYSVLFVISAMTLCGWLQALLGMWTGLPGWSLDLALLGLMVTVLVLGFGRISRRFERQSDVIAAWVSGPREPGDDPDRITPEGAAIYAQSLQQVARLNGIPTSQPNWRHGSIADRVSYVLWLGSRGDTRREVDRVVGRTKLIVWMMVGLAAGLTTAALVWDAVEGFLAG